MPASTMQKGFAAIIMAAGQGKRMNSDLPKVLHPLNGKPLIDWVVQSARAAGATKVVVVVGHGRDQVVKALPPGVEFCVQDRQLGTGHAVLCAEPAIATNSVLVLCGDTPLIPVALLDELLARHDSVTAACTAIAARLPDPGKYGRMITGADGRLSRIVEWKDASEAERAVNLVNSGIYAFHAGDLFHCLKKVRNDNAQGEYYLTDVVGMLVRMGRPVELVVTDDPVAVMGINTPQELAEAERLYAERAKRAAGR